MRFNSYVITWADQTPDAPSPDQIIALANSARAHAGELLALGPVHDSSEQDSRPLPSWIGIAGMASESAAMAGSREPRAFWEPRPSWLRHSPVQCGGPKNWRPNAQTGHSTSIFPKRDSACSSRFGPRSAIRGSLPTIPPALDGPSSTTEVSVSPLAPLHGY